MKKIKIFLIVLGWQITGFIATLVIALPRGDFHFFVHELMLCLSFTNMVGLSAMLLIWLNRSVLRPRRIPKFLKAMILALLFVLAAAASLKSSLKLGSWICGLDSYMVNRWHLSVLALDFALLSVISVVTVILALYDRLAERLELKIRENEKLHRLQIESKLSLLQSRINPHFLFNTLNTILDVLHRDVKKVEKIILNLSDIYRKTLMMPDHDLIPLNEEITLVEEYLEIEKIRMGDRLRYTFQIDDALKSYPFPPMMIQILVENAIKHGLSSKKEGGEVKVTVARGTDSVTLDVLDTGIGFDPHQPSGGFGLASIQQRLKLMYENAKMEMSALKTGGTQVRIILPYVD